MNEDKKTNQEIIDSAIDAVKKDRKNCDHVGFHVGYGFEMIQMPDGSMEGIHAIVCMMCGAVFCPRTVVIPAPHTEGLEPPKSEIIKGKGES